MHVFLFTKMKKIILCGMMICLICISLVLKFVTKTIEVMAPINSYCIVVDAGHGKPDGGAVSLDNIEEEGLNLAIAQKLKEALEIRGYDVVMTRETHENIASDGKKNSIKEIKKSDLENRVKIANGSNADFMISIHMNQFSKSNYWGWQTFYSKNNKEGVQLATLVQSHISSKIDRPNKRTVLPIDGIKIVDKTNLPVIIVECGFLSNEEDVRLLQTEEYQNKLVEGIVDGVEAYYEEREK